MRNEFYPDYELDKYEDDLYDTQLSDIDNYDLIPQTEEDY